ncbi:MAG: HAD family hydrolase [Rhizobiaceae bacterium]
MRRPDLIVFDCDGVLIDSEIISANVLIALLKPLGLEIDLIHIQRNFLGRSFPTVATSIRRDFDLALPENFESDYRSQLLAIFEDDLQPTPDIARILETLPVRFCVATSSSPERARRSLQIVDLFKFFQGHIYTASQVANGKPAPDLFLHVAKSEGVEPQNCLVIEDSMPGVHAALAAGTEVLRYIGGSHFDGIRNTLRNRRSDFATFDSWQDFFDMVPALRSEIEN